MARPKTLNRKERVMIGIDRHLYIGLKEVILHDIKRENKHISIRSYIEKLIYRHLKNRENKEGLVVLYERKDI